MKKYLSKNILKIQVSAFIFILLSIFLSSNVFAQTKLDYYKKLFSTEFGFTLSNDTKEQKEEALISNISKSESDSGYLIIFSSDMLGEGDIESILERHNKIILICDDNYSTSAPLSFSCDRFEASSTQLEKIGFFLRSVNRQETKTDLYVIPENVLASVEGRSDIQKYFNALKRSDNSFEDFEKKSTEKNILGGVKNLLNTTTFEIFISAISMFVFASIFFGLVKFFSSEERREFDLSFIKSFLVRLSEFFISHRWIVVYTLLVTLLIYIPIVVTLSVKDGQGVSLGYFISYSLDTFKISNLVGYIDQANYTRVAIFFYNFIFLVTLAIFFIPYVINAAITTSSKIGNSTLKSRVYKYVVPTLVILSLFVSLSLDSSKSPGFLILVVTILLFIVTKGIKNKEFNYKYSLREKGVAILLAILTITFSYFVEVRKSVAGHIYSKEDLIGISDDVVVLPYTKEVGNDVLFKERLTVLSEPIFVNQYIIYSPSNSRVENKNVREFKNEGSFLIQNGDTEDVVLSLDSNQNISSILMSSSPTNFFKIEGRFDNEDKKIQITFSCASYNLKSGDIRSNFYHLNKNGKVEMSKEILLHFPGCSKIGNPETYTVEFNPPYFETEYIFMELVDVTSSDISEIKIINSSNTVEPIYFLKSTGYSIITSGGLTDSSKPVITNYIFGDSYDLSFDVSLDSEGKFDISQPINELVRNGVLKDSFLIWSTKKYLPIRSN